MSGISARPPAFGQLFSAPTRPPSPVTLPFPAWRAQDGLLDGARAPRGLRRALVCARGESQQCADLPSSPLAESRSAVWQVLGDSQRRFVMVPNAAKGASAQVCTSICARADRSCRAPQPPVMARSMGGQSRVAEQQQQTKTAISTCCRHRRGVRDVRPRYRALTRPQGRLHGEPLARHALRSHACARLRRAAQAPAGQCTLGP